MIEIRLIGELEVIRNGELAKLPNSRKTRALLAYLILNPDSHRRERLCEIFWQAPDNPRGSLRWSLSKLRHLVDEDGIKRIIADDIENARARGDYKQAATLKLALRHFIDTHPLRQSTS